VRLDNPEVFVSLHSHRFLNSGDMTAALWLKPIVRHPTDSLIFRADHGDIDDRTGRMVNEMLAKGVAVNIRFPSWPQAAAAFNEIMSDLSSRAGEVSALDRPIAAFA
jgi:hypothetical protein